MVGGAANCYCECCLGEWGILNVSPSLFDTGVCSSCGRVDEVANPMIIHAVTSSDIDPEDWLRYAPRISDQARQR